MTDLLRKQRTSSGRRGESPDSSQTRPQGGFCIFGEEIASALAGQVKGGSQLQAALLARSLARGGVRVTIVDPLAPAPADVEPNLRIEPVPEWNGGMRGLRLIFRRIPGCLRVLRSTGAAVFYARGMTFLHLVPLWAARRSGSRFVLSVASDTDLLGFRERYTTYYRGKASAWVWASTILPNEIAYRNILRAADILIVQQDRQLELARARGKQAILIRNILDDSVLRHESRGARGKAIIVVGTISLPKGLRELMPLMRRLPEVPFEFVGEATDCEGRDLMEILRSLPNVRMHGALGRAETIEKIATARALLNTSPYEGFPNTFLEAWALLTPVISLHVDPGGTIAADRLGYVCGGDMAVLEELLRRRGYDLDLERIRDYVIRNHSADQAVQAISAILGID
jgi:hypothetical protein